MKKEIAVAFVHGMGEREQGFAEETKKRIKAKLSEQCRDAIAMEDIYWADAFQDDEDALVRIADEVGLRTGFGTRTFLINFLADIVAYQVDRDDYAGYIKVHAYFADTIKKLRSQTSDTAPLIVVAHSLGTIIASNYLYDLQNDFQHEQRTKFKAECIERYVKPENYHQVLRPEIKKLIGDNPFEHGETLTYFITMGCPLPIYNMRHKNPPYGLPIELPAPMLRQHHAGLQGKWLNFYDKDDIIGFALQALNGCYSKVVEDVEVNVGPFLENWNPFSHRGYWTNQPIVTDIAEKITGIWNHLNAQP